LSESEEEDDESEEEDDESDGDHHHVARPNSVQFIQPDLSRFEDVSLADDADDSTSCCICFLNEKRIALVPCGHVCLCGACASTYTKSETSKINGVACPICKTMASTAIVIYK
jgi:hypothetical protein